jgi:hypothetical protein
MAATFRSPGTSSPPPTSSAVPWSRPSTASRPRPHLLEVHLRLVRTPAGANQVLDPRPRPTTSTSPGTKTSGATFWKTATNTSPRTSSGSPKEVSEVDDPSPVGAASEQLSDKRPFDLVGDQPAGGRADVSERAWPDAHSAGNRSARPPRLASSRGPEPASDETSSDLLRGAAGRQSTCRRRRSTSVEPRTAGRPRWHSPPRLAPQPGWGGDNGIDSCGTLERSARHVNS